MAISSVSRCTTPDEIVDIVLRYAHVSLFDDCNYIKILTPLFRARTQSYTALPDTLVRDPVTMELLEGDCRITSCGHTFNHTTLSTQFAAGHNSCAICHAPVTADTLRLCAAVSSVMEKLAFMRARLTKVFLEIDDREIRSPIPADRLAAFNRELSSRIRHLDKERQLERKIAQLMTKQYSPGRYFQTLPMYTAPMVTPCGCSIEREYVARGGVNCCRRILRVETCVTDYLMKSQIAWAKEYQAKSDWAVRDLETLPDKAGVFLYLSRDTCATDLIGDLVEANLFNRVVQIIAPKRSGTDYLAALEKFQNLEQLKEAISTFSNSPYIYERLPVQLRHSENSYTINYLSASEKLTSVPETISSTADSYIHLILQQCEVSFLAPELLDILQTDAELQAAALV